MKQALKTKRAGIIRTAIEDFSTAGSKTIAEVLFRKNKCLFSSLEDARSAVRYYRGASGNKNRGRLKSKQLVRPLGKAGASFPVLPAMPKGITSFKGWGSLKIDGPAKALLLSDIHVPYHDERAIEVASTRGAGADLIILNGDMLDCYEVSSFQPDPRKCDFAGALSTAREFLAWLRGKFPKARIIYKEGNHEERMERYFTVRAPAVLGCEEFELKNLLKLADYGVEWLGEKRPIKLGKMHIIHGHEFRMAFSNPVNPARGLFLRSKVHAIEGHYHQSSQHAERDLAGSTLSCWSTGCLCDTHPEYAPLNNWVLGAAVVEIDKNGAFQVDNFRIIDGKAY
jgi:predicted phosphodiesterase